MRDAGRIGFVIKGEYQEGETYEKLDIVYYDFSSYVALKNTTGNLPTNSEYWQIIVKGYADISKYVTTDQLNEALAGYVREDSIETENIDFSAYFE